MLHSAESAFRPQLAGAQSAARGATVGPSDIVAKVAAVFTRDGGLPVHRFKEVCPCFAVSRQLAAASSRADQPALISPPDGPGLGAQRCRVPPQPRARG